MSAEQLAADICLLCCQSRAEVQKKGTFCGIVDYFGELEVDWPRHHWRDWSDAELAREGIKPEAFDTYRRASIHALPYAESQHRVSRRVREDGPSNPVPVSAS